MMQEALFTIIDQSQFSQEQERLLSVIQNRPTTAEVQIARLTNTPAAMLKKDKTIVLNVSPGKQFIAVEKRKHGVAPMIFLGQDRCRISMGGPLWFSLIKA